MARRKPQVGDRAIHPTLDSREVAEVLEIDGETYVKLQFWDQVGGPFPAKNYKFKEAPSA
ncbi:hypothetical protein SEA_TURBOVICKY_42 [Microbacterium phage TurboVicky]|nr:hypothetical protein SEA_TYPHER_44 [Microbacterium phage Typher]UVK60373.1 hypothetical protein SEA_TURBOVICKY_42 [Microbacterium phage TurboVicky]